MQSDALAATPFPITQMAPCNPGFLCIFLLHALGRLPLPWLQYVMLCVADPDHVLWHLLDRVVWRAKTVGAANQPNWAVQ